MIEDLARHRAQMPVGSERFLDTRELASDHRRLAALLEPGMRVLDVGCGSGAITCGIARAVEPGGAVLGIDVNAELIGRAATVGADLGNLSFELADIHQFAASGEGFDLVNAARVLQWLAEPQDALEAMVAATRPGGSVVVLDYDHSELHWDPEPPVEVAHFYTAFLLWRAGAGMDNELAKHLPGMFVDAGLGQIVTSDENEVTERGGRDFERRIALWGAIIATRGHQIVADGLLSEADRARAEAIFARWAADEARTQELRLVAVSGVRPLS
jgi:SAM-dependent methyltransferase